MSALTFWIGLLQVSFDVLENLSQTELISENKYSIPDDFYEQVSLMDKYLLKTINAIISVENDHLSDNKSFFSSIEEVDIIEFVKIFFKKDYDDFLFLTELGNDKNKTNSEKIKEMIQFLSHKEPIFSTYLFNFNYQKHIKSSRALFFTKFLDYFFLKQPKQKLLERCKTFKKKFTIFHFLNFV